MLIARSLPELAALAGADRPSVVTIGNFDGVHVGHQAVIAAVRAAAALRNARSVVVTFDPHPAYVLGKQSGASCPALITPLGRKLELLAQTGVDLTLVLPFNDDLRTLSARQFARTVLHDALRAAEVHEGENFRFGYRAEADTTGLAALGQELGFTVQCFVPVVRRGAPVSSSRIRSLVAAGEMRSARALLSRPFAMDSTPASGRGYGSRYTVPTVNLATPDTLLPAHGVYATVLRIGSPEQAQVFRGVTNAGNRPTFGADSYAIETHLFNFEPLALDESTPLRLTFLHRIREERRFPNPAALKDQIGLDVREAQRFFALCDARQIRL